MIAGRCSTCGAPVIWATTPRGRAMPLDPSPVVDGNVRLETRAEAPTVVAVVLAGDKLQTARTSGERLLIAHFVTCPSANAHRRQRPRKVAQTEGAT